MIMQDTSISEGKSLLQNRPFVLLWIAQALTQTAQNGIFFVLIVLITEATGSTTQLSLLVFSTILPSLLFGLAAGVVVDRQSKRLVMVLSNVARALLVVAYLGAGDTLVLIYLVNLLFSSVSQFFAPAEASTIPMVVPKNQLMQANGFFNLTFTASQFAGLIFPIPFVLKLFGSYWTLLALCAAYIIATALVFLLPRDSVSAATKQTSGLLLGLWDELKEGWGYIRSSPVITFAMTNMTTATTLILVLSVIAAPFVKKVVGIRADDAVYILAPAGIGVALGVVLSPRIARVVSGQRLITFGMVALAICLILFGSTNWLGRYLALGMPETAVVQWLLGIVIGLSYVMGLSFAFVTIPAQTILQERSPIPLRGKIMATQLTMGNVATIFPILFVGGLADLFGIAEVIVLVGIAVLAIGIVTRRRLT